MIIHIQLTRPKGFKLAVLSWLVRLFQGTPYSHCLLRWQNRHGLDVVYESSGTCVKFLGPRAAKDRYKIMKSYEVSLTKDEYQRFIDFCITYAGLDYGLRQVFGVALVYIFKLRKNPFADGTRSWACSEVIGRFFEDVKNESINLDLDVAGPREIDQYLARSNYREVING